MHNTNTPITLSRNAVQDIVQFLGKLSIDSGASVHYTTLRAALDTPAPVAGAPATAPVKVKAALKAKAPAAVTLSEKELLKKKKAAENARQWRLNQKAAKAAKTAQASVSAPVVNAPVAEEPIQPVLFTG